MSDFALHIEERDGPDGNIIWWQCFCLVPGFIFSWQCVLVAAHLTLSPSQGCLLQFLVCLLHVIKKKPKGWKESAWVAGTCTHQLNTWQCFLLDGLICQGDGQDLVFVPLTNQQMSNLWMCSLS